MYELAHRARRTILATIDQLTRSRWMRPDRRVRPTVSASANCAGVVRRALDVSRGRLVGARAHECRAADESAAFVGTFDDVVIGYGIVEVVELTRRREARDRDRALRRAGGREVGVGETIVNALLEWCRERECIGVDATALPGHRVAKNFFEEQGFVSRSLTMYRGLPPATDPEAGG